jgi:hypothetical protein
MADHPAFVVLLSGLFRGRTSRRKEVRMSNGMDVLAIALLVAMLVIDRLAR